MIAGEGALRREDTVSSVPLQLLIYVNAILACIFIVFVGGFNMDNKNDLEHRSQLNKALVAPVLVTWLIAEAARLYCGYYGNLNEKVPETSTFLLLSCFPQFPALAYLTFLQEHVYPLDFLFGFSLLILLLLEGFVGTLAFQTLIRRQTAHFYRLCQEEG